MQQQTYEQPIFHCPDEKVSAEQVRPVIKCLAIVGTIIQIEKDHAVERTMHYQKNDEKKPREPHHIFFTWRRSEKLFPCHKRSVGINFRYTKILQEVYIK